MNFNYNLEKLETILKNVSPVIEEENKRKLSGNNFNIFSILKFEYKENGTHSAFLSELLNPQGSHEKGYTFLELFLNTIRDTRLDIYSCTVKREHFLDIVNYDKESGGKVDIYISDKNNKTICVENKILAGDQHKQILRYHNHNNQNNKVYYLTLYGSEPAQNSKGALKSGVDFYKLSYSKDILAWLERCLEECVNTSFLYQSISQYIYLIKKITNQMSSNLQTELVSKMFENIFESSYIANNFPKEIDKLTEDVRQLVLKKLNDQNSSGFIFRNGNPTNGNVYSQIWIDLEQFQHRRLRFGIESFSGKGHLGGNLFIGIFTQTAGNKSAMLAKYACNYVPRTSVWVKYEEFVVDENKFINFADEGTLKKLFFDTEYKDQLANKIVEQTLSYLKSTASLLIQFLRENPDA